MAGLVPCLSSTQRILASVRGLRAIWALADVNEGDGGLVVVPASHNSSVDAPQDLVSGDDNMGLVVQPVLQAGDLLLCTESLMWGLRPWQVEKVPNAYSNAAISAPTCVRPQRSEITGEDDTMPEWTAALTPVQRAVLHNPNRGYPPPAVHSDGKTVSLAAEPGIIHPSIYKRDPDSGNR